MSNSISISDYAGTPIQKSIEQTYGLKKGGEGSRGGKVIGHTSSGKPVYENFNHPDHKDFSDKDHMDASGVHKKMIDKQKTAIDVNKHAFAALDHINATGVHKKFKEALNNPSKEQKEHEQKTREKVSFADKMNKQIEKHNKKFSGYGIKKAIDDNYAAGKIDALTYLKANVQLGNLLEKATPNPSGSLYTGEGSRGGRVIGHTKSGKPIYAAGHKTEDYDKHDHADASIAHRKEADSYTKDHPTSDYEKHHRNMANLHAEQTMKQSGLKWKDKTKSGKEIHLHENDPNSTSAGGIHGGKFKGWSKEDHMDAMNHHIDEKNKINAKWHEESKAHIASGRSERWEPSSQENKDRVNHFHNMDAHHYHLVVKHGTGRDEMNAHVNKRNNDFVEKYKQEHA